MMACICNIEVGCFYVKQPNVKGISGDAVKAASKHCIIILSSSNNNPIVESRGIIVINENRDANRLTLCKS